MKEKKIRKLFSLDFRIAKRILNIVGVVFFLKNLKISFLSQALLIAVIYYKQTNQPRSEL